MLGVSDFAAAYNIGLAATCFLMAFSDKHAKKIRDVFGSVSAIGRCQIGGFISDNMDN